jgi:hypothetical protein
LYKFFLAINLIVLSLISSCVSPQQAQRQSTMQLCMDLLTHPTYNVNYENRVNELARRGENCSSYYGQAAAVNQANRDLDESLRYLNNLYTPRQNTYYVQGLSQGTHTFQYQGRTVTCVTSGTVTSCF